MKFNITLYVLFLTAHVVAVQSSFIPTAVQAEERIKRDALREEECDARYNLLTQAHSALVQLVGRAPQQLVVHGSGQHRIEIAGTGPLNLVVHSGTVFMTPKGATFIENHEGEVNLAFAPHSCPTINAVMNGGTGRIAAAPGSRPVINCITNSPKNPQLPKIEEIE